MEPTPYKCCRCGSPLPAGEPDQPWRCTSGCGEWLTREAVDAYLFLEVLKPPERPAQPSAPHCVICDAAMQALLGEPYHLCAQHGIWFDTDDRQSFERVLSSRIAKHRDARQQRSAQPPKP